MMKQFTFLAVAFTLFSLSLEAQNLIATTNSNQGFEGVSGDGTNIYWWYQGISSPAVATMTASTTTPHSGARCLRVVITAVTANAKDVQTINNNSSTGDVYILTAGVSYTFRFWAKADVAGRKLNAYMQNINYTAGTFSAGAGVANGITLTASWAQYTLTFTPTTTQGLRPTFEFGTQTGTISLDDVELGTTATIPVELMAFNVNQNNNNKTVDLNWQVAQELRLKDYTVQRSLDGKKFDDISVVSAKNSPAMTQYAFQDESPINGANYYRLKINEQDGTFKYSAIQSAMIGSNKGSVSVEPNPTTGLIQLKNADAFESLDVYDLNGRIVRQFSNNANQLDISDLPKGVYQITIKAKGTMSFAKVVKM
jgi:Secretion system C-terminal sorting domain/Carbohydrate binding domain